MKIETRYRPDKSAEQKGEGIIESSWGKHYRKQQLNPYFKKKIFFSQLSNSIFEDLTV